ncbi:hypothetical protein BDV19DRAFT_387703 [Aspergillus venezuelensis]
MAGTTHNHTNYEGRLAFIQQLLHNKSRFQEDASIVPIQYDPECPFKYNNSVYRVSLPAPLPLPLTPDHKSRETAGANDDGSLQPGCVAIPPGTKDFIIRLTNAQAEGQTLASFDPHVVPSVYGWGSAAGNAGTAQGWILQDFMPGTSLDEIFRDMSHEEKAGAFAQMAALLKALQDYQLPQNLTFGGVTFDGKGQVLSTAMTSVGAGPWSSYEDSFKSRLKVALQKADADSHIQGWRANGIRDSKEEKTIVHADFSLSNLLYNPTTRRMTAVLDYDFACILHPSYEFLRSFDGAGGQFRGWSGDKDIEELALREAKLHEFPSPLPDSTEDGVQWEDAKIWEDALEEAGVERPRTITGIDKVADVDAILRMILPWRLDNEDILRMQSEVIVKYRAQCEKQLGEMLERLGF